MSLDKPFKPKSRAILVSIRTSKVSDTEADESLYELKRLVSTLGLQVIGQQRQRRAHTRGGTVVGEGKLKELAELTGGPGFVERAIFAKPSKAAERRAALEAEDAEDETSDQTAELHETSASAGLTSDDLAFEFESDAESSKELANIVIFDCDLSPSQLRNLESALACEVMDRTGVIIEIFSRHAKTRAARLQVEIARLNYLAPRLRETGGGTERQAGRGSGESELELDRRNIRDRVNQLKTELEVVQKEQIHRRAQRAEQRCVALVGYTNAGKSSMMRALTGSEVLVQDKLFATLDTTVRALQPEKPPRILVSDTVGFIKSLPHDLVASFRSTLDEAHNASLLLYVVDSSDASFREQLKVTREVLGEVGVTDTPSLLILNKRDRLSEAQFESLLSEFPEALMLCTREPADVAALSERIRSFFEQGMSEEEIVVRYDVPGLMGEIRGNTRVVRESFENEGVRMTVRAPSSVLEKIKRKFHL